MARDAQLTPQAVVNQLSELGRDLDALVRSLKDADLDAVTKRHAADIEESKAYVGAEGAVKEREHLPRLAADPFESEALVAEAVCRYLKARIRSVEVRVDIGRSYSAALRAEFAALPGMPGP